MIKYIKYLMTYNENHESIDEIAIDVNFEGEVNNLLSPNLWRDNTYANFKH